MKVIVAIDSSPFSYQVIEAVGKRLWPKDCQFKLLTRTERCGDWDAEQQFCRQSEIILEDRLAQLRKALPDHKIDSDVDVGPAAEGIIATATEWKADLIVLGSHGDTGIRKSHIGSVAAAVVNNAPCNVELIKVIRLPKPEKSQRLAASKS